MPSSGRPIRKTRVCPLIRGPRGSRAGCEYNLPDATIYGANFESSLSGAIAPALQNAYNKGVRVIDIPFLFGSAFPTTPLTEQNSLYPNEQVNGVKWLKAVESFNSKQTVVANKFRVRIRFLAYASNLWVYAQYYLPGRLGLGTVSGLPALQDDYGALQANGQRSLLIPDLSNAKIRQAIGVYAKNIISEAKKIATTTTIESMTLILDAGGETSLFPIDGEVMPYGFRTQQPFYSGHRHPGDLYQHGREDSGRNRGRRKLEPRRCGERTGIQIL